MPPTGHPGTDLAPAIVDVERRADGAMVLRSPHPLGAYERHVCVPLRRFADSDPSRVFLAERGPAGSLARVTYAEARARVDRLAAALAARGLSAERPLLILSENGIDHALLTLAAMQIGAPAAPISTAYSLQSRGHDKLRAIARALGPGLVYASDAERYGRALDALGVSPSEIVTSREAPRGGATLRDLEASSTAAELSAAEARFQALGPGDVAKVLFTSGSTGEPKGVINTQRMLCSNQQAIVTLWPFLRARPPVVVDWLPWSHTFGGNHNFNMVLFHGGSLIIDEGRPTPELIARTARNLAEVSPTIYFNVPRGYDMLLPFLEQDEALRASFFRDLDALFYAAASLPHPLWQRLEAVAAAAGGAPPRMLSAWGSTETAPMATSVHERKGSAGIIGLPAPGSAIKLAPMQGKLELRVQGPNVTPGYWRRPELLAEALDEEGFFRMGDAGKLLDLEDPARGIVFDGRIAEDFKLASGTWVHVGALRQAILAAAAPLVQDAVLTGLDRDEVGALLILAPLACAAIAPSGSAEEIAASPEVRARLVRALSAHNEANSGSSQRVGRFAILIEPLGIDAGEITDKGYINQRAVLARRAEVVEQLYAGAGATVTLPRA